VRGRKSRGREKEKEAEEERRERKGKEKGGSGGREGKPAPRHSGWDPSWNLLARSWLLQGSFGNPA